MGEEDGKYLLRASQTRRKANEDENIYLLRMSQYLSAFNNSSMNEQWKRLKRIKFRFASKWNYLLFCVCNSIWIDSVPIRILFFQQLYMTSIGPTIPDSIFFNWKSISASAIPSQRFHSNSTIFSFSTFPLIFPVLLATRVVVCVHVWKK